MSILSVWIIGLIIYLIGVCFGRISSQEQALEGPIDASFVLAIVILLVLIGVKIGGST